ncbi:MAG: lyase [Flavobacteriales bacterium]|nr:lyase [Flavobacteriales bacterium]
MKYVNRKAMIIRESGRSSDFITPSFGYGCLYKCSYCYMRRHVKKGLTIAKNTEEIIDAIARHLWLLKWPKEPNQTHSKYYTYDFSCNEDYVLHAKYHNWEYLFDYFKNDPKAMGTAATKYVNKNLLSYNANRKVRIRFSIMPQKLSDILEPGTSKIVDRIKAVNDFYEAGYDVHLNYSPIIMYEDFQKDYNDLFRLVDSIVDKSIKNKVKAECIFLTHNKEMHKYNVINDVNGEKYLWRPELQEPKTSEYGCLNIRYNRHNKKQYIKDFKQLHNTVVPWQKIRYIF